MENKNKQTAIEKKIVSPKLLLILSILLIFTSGIAVIVSLAVGGYDFIYYLFPIALLTCDLLFGLVTVFSNYRFRYSIPYPIIYLIITIALTLSAVITNGGAVGVSLFTYVFAYAFLILHLIAVVSVTLGYLYACYGKGAKTKRALSFLSVMVLCASVIVYSSMILQDGWFGQGAVGVQRPVEFEYDEGSDSYTAAGILAGKGDTVVIPATFNGKPVTTVDCAMFSSASIRNIYLSEGINYASLKNTEVLNSSSDRTIYAGDYDDVRNGLYLNAYRSDSEVLLEIANMVAPSLPEDKVYVTFTYTMEDLKAVKGNVVPVWVGNAGDVLTDAELMKFEYISHAYNAQNKDNHHWAYENVDKRIFVKAVFDEGYGFGKVVDKSIDNVLLHFEPLMKIDVAEDNDTVYPEPDNFKYYIYNEEKVSNIFIASEIEPWFATYATRDGFSLSWTYTLGNKTENFTTISDVVADSMTITPKWSLNLPVIDSITSSGSIVYGQTAAFTSVGTSPSESINIFYDWTVNGSSVSTDPNFDILDARPQNSGDYKLTLTAKNESITSLSVSVDKTVTLNVGKRPVSVKWTVPADAVYSASDKLITWAFDTATGENFGIINGDALAFTENSASIKNVKCDADSHVIPYSFTATLLNFKDLYYITAETQTKEFTITPAPLSVTWSNTSLVYNSTSQKPTASAVGLGSDGDIAISVNGAQKNAGNDYNATAVSDNTNYEVTALSANTVFTITPAPVDVTWQNFTFTYNADAQAPTPFAAGVGSDSAVAFTLSGSEINAGDNYTASVVSADPNYVVVSGASTTYTIKPLEVNVQWSADALVYNATAQAPVATTNAAVGSDVPVFPSTGTGTTVKTGYTVSVDKDITGNYVASASTKTFEFDITAAPVILTWNLGETIVYDGTSRVYQVSALGIQGTDNVTFVYAYTGTSGSNIAPVNKGTYSVAATLDSSNSVNSNYYIQSGASRNIEIKPLGVTPVWTNGSFTYDGTAHTVSIDRFEGLTDSTLVNEVRADLVYTGETETNASNYVANLSLQPDSNFTITANASYNYTIARRELTVTWANATLVYNGSAQTVDATITGMISSHSASDVAKINNNTHTNAGVYTANVELLDTNYIINANIVQNISIARKGVDVVWTNTTVTFDGAPHSPTLHYLDVNSLPVTIDTSTNTITNYTQTDAGTYTVKITDFPGGNYTLNTTTTERVFKINPMDITIEWSAVTFVYNGTAQIPTPTAKNNGSTVTINGLRAELSSGRGIDIGNYRAVVAHSAKATNYNIIGGTDTNDYTITPLQVQLNWSGTSVTFNNLPQKPTATVSVSGGAALPATVITAVNVTLDGNGKDAISYLATGTLTNSNLQIISGEQSTFVINPLEVKYDFGSTSSFVYNNQVQKPNVVVKTYNGGTTVAYAQQVLNVAITAGDGKNVGSATITATLNSNYIVADAIDSFTYTITPKKVNLTWQTPNFTYTGLEQLPTVTVKSQSDGGVLTGLYSDANAVVALTTGDGISATTHMVGATLNSNYEIVSGATYSYTIQPKKVILEWQKPNFIYTGSAQMPTAIVKAQSDNSVISGVNAIVSPAASYDCTSAGTQKVDAALDSSNYTIAANASYTYTIAPYEVTLEWQVPNFTYTGAIQMPSAIVKSKADSSIISGVNATPSLVSGYNGINAGTQKVKATLDSANYKIVENETFEYNILPFEVTLEWQTPNFTYTGNVQKPTATVKAKNGGAVISSVNAVVSMESDYNGINAGAQKVRATLSSANYIIVENDTYSYTIAQKTVTLHWQAPSFTYTGSVQKPTLTVKDSSSNNVTDAVVSINTVSGYDGISAGEQKVAVILNANYTTTSSLEYTYNIAKKAVNTTWSMVGGIAVPSTNVASSVYNVIYEIDNEGSWTVVDHSTVATTPGSYRASISLNDTNHKLGTNSTYNFVVSGS